MRITKSGVSLSHALTRKLLPGLFAFVAFAACRLDHGVEPSVEINFRPIPAPLSCGNGAGGGADGATKIWACWDTLVFTANANLHSELGGHLADWSGKLGSAFTGAPMLMLSGDMPPLDSTPPHRKQISVTGAMTTDGTFCGQFGVTGSSGWINVTSGNCGPYSGVFANELAGIVGYGDGADVADQAAPALPYRGHCTRFIPDNGFVVNSTVCAHEAEGILSAYGIRSGASISLALQHILTSLSLSTGGGTVLPMGSTLSVQVISLGFDGGNASLTCGEDDPGCVSPNPSELSYQWETSDPSVVAVNQSGVGAILTAGQSGTATITVDVTNPGPYALGTLFNGNGTPVSFTVSVPTGADLSLGNYTPPNLSLGTSATLAYTTSNIGTGTAIAPWSDRFYLSADGILDRNADTLFASNTVNSSQAAGLSLVRTVTLTAPPTYNVGVRRLIGSVDDSNVVLEPNETNNQSTSRTINIVYAPGLDLAATRLAVTLGANGTYSYYYQTRNIGTSNVSCINARFRLYLSSDQVVSNDDYRTVFRLFTPCPTTSGTTSGNNLPEPLTRGLFQNGGFTFPPAGTYYLLMKTDSENSLAESNEANNVIVGTQQIVLP